MGALKPIFDWDTPSSYDELSGVVDGPTLNTKDTVAEGWRL